MDSAVRKLVKEMREIVAEEVRAQVGTQIQVPASAPLSVVASETREQDAGSAGSREEERTKGEHLAPHAPTDPAQPNFDAAEAAWFLRFTSMKAFYQAVHRYGIPHARRGARVMLFRRVDLEKFIASRSRGR
ncbi:MULTISPECIES: helix-turn-helix domain-containing protein [Anaeromyxobacter]|uniref:helix-turn-helix domain-containing protein n=1 Tax=Anaeromyxobacter TaxID=161492 RepID=UPI001F57D60E|nr:MULTISPECIES: helix-turn-helix domain-containing protein [unclassified Anaeromyxobacter]